MRQSTVTGTTCAALCAAALFLTLTPETARGANPHSATYSKDAARMFWIVHISDSHIGASAIEGPHAAEHFAWALGEAVTTIDPILVVHSGDLCDGSLNNIPASGQDQAEWDEYLTLVDDAGWTTDFYWDLVGNHDGYGDTGLTYYLANSLLGSAEGVPWRSEVLSLPFGEYLIFALNTAGNGSGPFIEDPAYTADEVTALQTALQTHAASDLALLFGHHGIGTPDGSADVITAAQQNDAFYFHGHVHSYGSYLGDGIVNAQVNSLGKSDTNNLAVIAVDNNALSYAATDTADPWPLVVVTAPADRRLDDDAVSPYAYDVCNTATDNPVRALVFDATTVSSVTFEVAGGTPVSMSQDASEPRLWLGSWDTTSLAAGETTLTVTAVGSTTRSRSVSVMLADVDCPPDEEVPADAGVDPDASLPPADAGIDSGTETDAETDASPGADASTTPTTDDGGCSCRTTSGRLPLLPLLMILLFAVRRFQ